MKEEDFEELAWEYFLRARSDGVVHAEVFFDPQAHTARGVKFETVLNGFERACQRADAELGISAKLILCFLRHLPVPESHAMYGEALSHLVNQRLAGIGLDSSEKGNPPINWKEIYVQAKTKGIRRTAHAGEEGPVEYIKEALKELDVERIDHGIRLVDDHELMREIAERQILVTVCPLSNVRLKCVKEVKELPIQTFLDCGVKFSINSDDPAYFSGYILDNYCAVQDAFNLTIKDWTVIATAAVQGSWCDDTRKSAIMEQLHAAVNQFST